MVREYDLMGGAKPFASYSWIAARVESKPISGANSASRKCALMCKSRCLSDGFSAHYVHEKPHEEVSQRRVPI